MSLYNDSDLSITGTLVNYYIHCKRQCWLFVHRINLEDESELVKIGKALHEKKEINEIEIDNIKIDKISKEYLTEIKKSDGDTEAAKYQLLFYLKKLKEKGINRKGKLEIIEKNKKQKTSTYELNPKYENELLEIEAGIKQLFEQKTAPMMAKTNKCQKCAYYAYCFI